MQLTDLDSFKRKFRPIIQQKWVFANVFYMAKVKFLWLLLSKINTKNGFYRFFKRNAGITDDF